MQTSLNIFMSDYDGKMDDEEDPDLSETEENNRSRRNKMSGSVHKNKRYSLSLYSSLHSSIHSTTKNSDIDLEEDSSEVKQTPLPASRPTQRSGSLEAINEVGERSKDEYDNSSKPDMKIDEPRPRPRVSFQNNRTNSAVRRRSMIQSKSSMLVTQKSRLFDSNEVMHLMGFDDEWKHGFDDEKH